MGNQISRRAFLQHVAVLTFVVRGSSLANHLWAKGAQLVETDETGSASTLSTLSNIELWLLNTGKDKLDPDLFNAVTTTAHYWLYLPTISNQ